MASGLQDILIACTAEKTPMRPFAWGTKVGYLISAKAEICS